MIKVETSIRNVYNV